jgi:hypothetical protein
VSAKRWIDRAEFTENCLEEIVVLLFQPSVSTLFSSTAINQMMLDRMVKLGQSSTGEFHRPGFQDVKLWYEIDDSLNA